MLTRWKLYVLIIFAGTFFMLVFLQKTTLDSPHYVLLPDSRKSRDNPRSRTSSRTNHRTNHRTNSVSPMLDRLRKKIDTDKKVSAYLATLNREKMMKVIDEFHLNGTEHFSTDTARRFLICHLMPEEFGTHVDKIQLANVCKKRKTFRETGKLIGLASFPGSGNTWTRTLLEQATGIYTGSIYTDTSLVNAGFDGECIMSNNVIAIKTHATFNPGLKERVTVKFDGVIYIVRNLYDALMSEHTRRITKSHVSALPASAFGTDRAWNDWVTKGCSRWINSIINWLYVYKGPVLVVQYEEIKKDVGKQLRRMLDFLEHPYTNDDVQCVANKQMEAFRRHKDKTFDPFTAKQRKLVQTSILKVVKLLAKYNVNYTDWQ